MLIWWWWWWIAAMCLLPRAAGNCTEKIPKWFFDREENRCMPFYYTGCDGNDNQFDSEDECLEDCPKVVGRWILRTILLSTNNTYNQGHREKNQAPVVASPPKHLSDIWNLIFKNSKFPLCINENVSVKHFVFFHLDPWKIVKSHALIGIGKEIQYL